MEQATQLRAFWYVIARSRDVGAKPLARKVNDRAIVVFRDDRGNARVLDAVCPHRGADLAYGRVVGGHIVCPYHGWRFDGAGKCSFIPSPSKRAVRVPAAHATESFSVHEQQGLIWTCLGTPVAPPPRFEIFDDPALHSFCYELVAPVPLDWWVENALDFAHLPFVHPHTIGDERSSLEDFVLERRTDELGFAARAEGQDRSLIGRVLKLEMRVSVTFAMPGCTLFDFDLGRGRRHGILALATPEDGSSTHVWNFGFRNFVRGTFGDAIGTWFIRTLLREDLRSAERSLQLVSIDRRNRLSTRSDELGLEFIRLMRLWRSRETTSRVTHSK